MATNLKIDSDLLEQAKRIGRFRTKKEAVNQALTEFVQHRKQQQILEWEGMVDFFEDYDHKALRKRLNSLIGVGERGFKVPPWIS